MKNTQMKKTICIYLITLLLLIAFLSYVSNDFKIKVDATDEFKVNTKTYSLDGFVETWNDSMILTFDSSLSDSKSIKLWISDIFGTGGVIKWGDGNETELKKTSYFYTHDYGSNANGEYIIEISNNFEHFGSMGAPNENLANLSGLGAMHRFNDSIKKLKHGFVRAYNLVKVPEILPTSIIDVLGVFQDAWSFNQELNWNLENVTMMSSMFKNAKNFNQPLNFTNTSKATMINSMFEGAEQFNQPFSFDATSVTSMASMFKDARNFNESLSFSNTNNLKSVASMFEGAEKFNKELTFDTPSVTSMTSMFKDAREFNQSLNFDTKNVATMASMFEGAEKFNKELTFDIIKVASMRSMFKNAKAFDMPLSFINNTSDSLKNTNSMFSHAFEFNQLVNLNTENVTEMSEMFAYTKKFNQPINFVTSKVNLMNFMFKDAISFNQDLVFDLSNTTGTTQMFENAINFNGKINFTNSNKLLYLTNMFKNAIKFNQQVNLDTTNAKIMTGMFENALSFNQQIDFTNTSNVIAMERMFYETNSFDQDLSNLNFGEVTYFKEMLYNSKISTSNYNKLIEKIANDKREKNLYKPLIKYEGFSNRKRYVERINDFDKLYDYGYDFADSGIYNIKIKAIANYDKTGLVKNSDIVGLDTVDEKNELLNDIKYEIILEDSKKYLKIIVIESNKYKIEYENSLPLKEIINLENLELETRKFTYNGEWFELKFKNLPEHVKVEALTSKKESSIGKHITKFKFSTDEALYHIINYENFEKIEWEILKAEETAPENDPTPDNSTSENENNKNDTKNNQDVNKSDNQLLRVIIISIETLTIIVCVTILIYLLKRSKQ